MALGTASQFEERRWLDAETPNQSNNYPGGVVCLAKLYKDLFILLPRLIALTRETRNGDMTRAQEASELATTVLALTDQPAENQLLRRVTVKKTNHPADAYLVPFSMDFGYNGEFAAAICYWQTRILAHRLCLKLYELSIPLSPQPSEDHNDDDSTIRDSLSCENFRMATDIMMSWEFAFASGAMSLWGLRIGFIAPWAVASAVALQRDWVWSKPLSDHGRTKCVRGCRRGVMMCIVGAGGVSGRVRWMKRRKCWPVCR